MKEEKIIFFDGVCNLCNGAVQFIIRRDRKRSFLFSSLQSQFAMERLGERINPACSESIILLKNDKLFTKSRAALEIARDLAGVWPFLYTFIIVPSFLRDAVYDFIARNRYHWFGKRDSFMIPTPELKSRFLD